MNGEMSDQGTERAPLNPVPPPALDITVPLPKLRMSAWATASLVLALIGVALPMIMIIWFVLLSNGIDIVTGEQLGFSADYNFFPAIVGVYGLSFALALAGLIGGHFARWRLKHGHGGVLGNRQINAALTLGYFTVIIEFGAPLLLYIAAIVICSHNCS